MTPITQALLLKALDGLHARSVVIADNVANAGTPGFRPSHVRFEDALRQAAPAGAETVSAVRPQLHAGGVDGALELRTDLELATGTATALRYAALVDVLGRQLRLTALAHSGLR